MHQCIITCQCTDASFIKIKCFRSKCKNTQLVKEVMRLLWILPIIGSMIGALAVLFTFASSKGAPQEAAGFAFACAAAIIPYVFCRAVIALADETRRGATAQVVAAINAANSGKPDAVR